MSVFMGRDGNLSIFRIGLAITGFGVLLAVGGFVFTSFDQARRESPYYIDPYPDAVEWRTTRLADNAQEVLYQVPNVSPEEVQAYYQRKLDDHTGAGVNDPDREECVRNPSFGEFDNYEEGTGVVPYYYRCVFDNSLASGLFLSDGAIQFTTVTIQPGIFNPSTEVDTRGSTMILYEQRWSS